MPNWTIALLVVCVMVLGSCANRSGDQPIELLDGKHISEAAIAPDIYVSFDGKDELLIRKAGRSLKFSARSPSLLSFSPSRDVVALNFGNGSGQVYDVAVYNLSDGREIDIQPFRSSIIKHAREHGCLANPDVASIVVEKWMSDRQIRVATEDFSRKENCSVLNKTWTIELRPPAGG